MAAGRSSETRSGSTWPFGLTVRSTPSKKSPNEQWRVTAYGQNITDERYITGGVPLVDVTETAGTQYNLPRMYGVEAAFTW